MKKKLNLFCVLMLVLILAEIVIGVFVNFEENIQTFNQGMEGAQEGEPINYTPLGRVLVVVFGVPAFFGIIAAIIAFIRFIWNVNRDKVFVWQNVSMLRWTGWGIMFGYAYSLVMEYFHNIPLTKSFYDASDYFIFAFFCLIVAEAFAVGLKLKEEQELTI
jgi:hypothetical protein